MILADYQIEELCSNGDPLISPYQDQYLNAHSYDLTLGGNFKFPSVVTPGEWINTNRHKDEGMIRLGRGEFILAHTNEIIKVPGNLTGFVVGKSSVARNGLIIEAAGLVDSGFQGTITLELYNEFPHPLFLTPGMRIGQIYFIKGEEAKLKNYKEVGNYQSQGLEAVAPKYNLC